MLSLYMCRVTTTVPVSVHGKSRVRSRADAHMEMKISCVLGQLDLLCGEESISLPLKSTRHFSLTALLLIKSQWGGDGGKVGFIFPFTLHEAAQGKTL